MRRFEGYGVLITGAARGIGAATARRLAEKGAHVLVTDVDMAEAEKTAASIRELGARAEAFGCDVGERASVEAAVAYAANAFGSLDVLVGTDLDGVELRADDLDWSFGTGTPVYGAAQDLLLIAYGRKLPAGRLPGGQCHRFVAA